MQVSPNDVYRPPTLNETPRQQPDKGTFDVSDAHNKTREMRINEVRSELERLHFGKALLEHEQPKARPEASIAQVSHTEKGKVNTAEFVTYVRNIGEFIAYERSEVMKNGWSS
ncbi:hypothetical protein KC953_01570 [Candidatus Saccharibacteria bacterium]|nr:hypothetical protein [Candidatus Saccharibacteria bacterium]